jgi:hypothetical protein
LVRDSDIEVARTEQAFFSVNSGFGRIIRQLSDTLTCQNPVIHYRGLYYYASQLAEIAEKLKKQHLVVTKNSEGL